MSEDWHGTTGGFDYRGCRCDACREAKADRRRRDKAGIGSDAVEYEREWAALLHELAPDGLTDDCPARQRRMAMTA